MRYGPANEQEQVLKELLQVAFAGGNDGAQALRDLAASVRPSKGQPSWKALHLAVECGNLAMCRLLLAAGADINSPNMNGESVLHLAIETANIAMVKLLLSSGVKVNRVDKHGRTALYGAASCQFSTIIAGGSIDKSTTTAIDLGTQMVTILLAAGAKANAAAS